MPQRHPPTDSKEPIMCSPAVCPTCRKMTYSGCGMHVDQIFAGVPRERRCSCR